MMQAEWVICSKDASVNLPFYTWGADWFKLPSQKLCELAHTVCCAVLFAQSQARLSE